MEFESFAIVAAESDGVNGAGVEGDEVVEDGAGAAGLTADADNVMNGKSGLDRRLGLCRIDLEVTIQAEVSEKEDAKGSVARGDSFEP